MIRLNHAISKIVKLGVFNDVPNGQILTLLTVVAVSDDNGVVKITNQRLADLTGRTRKTIASDIKKLEGVTYNEEPVIKKANAVIGDKTVEVIKVNPVFLSEVRVGDNKEVNIEVIIEDTNENSLTPKAILKHFNKLYTQEFGVTYVINWARDVALIKKYLLGHYTDEELEEVIEIAVKDYTKRWATPQYPRPTVAMICKWLGKRALEVIATRKKEARIVAKYEAERELNKGTVENKLEDLFGV